MYLVRLAGGGEAVLKFTSRKQVVVIYDYLCFRLLRFAYKDVMNVCGFRLTIAPVTILALNNVQRVSAETLPSCYVCTQLCKLVDSIGF
jgi:hypothetical protein